MANAAQLVEIARKHISSGHPTKVPATICCICSVQEWVCLCACVCVCVCDRFAASLRNQIISHQLSPLTLQIIVNHCNATQIISSPSVSKTIESKNESQNVDEAGERTHQLKRCRRACISHYVTVNRQSLVMVARYRTCTMPLFYDTLLEISNVITIENNQLWTAAIESR